MDEVQTGAAAFGAEGQYGVLTKADSSRLLMFAMYGAIAKPEFGFGYRKLLRRMMGFVGRTDLVTLAEIARTAQEQHREWEALAVELLTKAGL